MPNNKSSKKMVTPTQAMKAIKKRSATSSTVSTAKAKGTAKYKESMAKPVKKASASSNRAVAKAGEAQRREMARTRVKRNVLTAAPTPASKAAERRRMRGFTYGRDTE